jgi:carboxymethylenebutenolidase
LHARAIAQGRADNKQEITMGEHITIHGRGGDFMAYQAKPADAPTAVIVVIQEIFGVNAVMRDLCEGFAAQGYLAVAPDLFWRIEPGIDITDQTPEEWQRAFDLYGKFNVDSGVADIQDTITAMRAHGLPVGSVGYCLGGLLAFLTTTRTDVDASVSYYGVGIDQALGEADQATRPLLLHIAEEDGFVNKDAQAAILAALSGKAGVAVHTYPGLDHAFARRGGDHYDEAGANLANSRTADFFKATLA